jgi:hypothetical protein
MKRPHLILSVAALAIGALSFAPASAQVTTCNFTSQVLVSPGVSLTPSAGTFTTPEGQPGTITCEGDVNGTGTITYSGVTGALGESCALDFQGSGVLEYVIDGNSVTGDFTFTRAGLAGVFQSDTTAGPLVGIFQFAPKEGQDCATVPVTEATVTGNAVVLYS